MRTDERIMKILSRTGVRYDSSLYAPAGTEPYDIGNGMKEIPVSESIDKNGKRITGYLWPMHEGKRGYDDFVNMITDAGEGTFVLATHSWHITESLSKGKLSSEEAKKNIADVKKITAALLDGGSKAVTMNGMIL
jgi:hypothetical protein